MYVNIISSINIPENWKVQTMYLCQTDWLDPPESPNQGLWKVLPVTNFLQTIEKIYITYCFGSNIAVQVSFPSVQEEEVFSDLTKRREEGTNLEKECGLSERREGHWVEERMWNYYVAVSHGQIYCHAIKLKGEDIRQFLISNENLFQGRTNDGAIVSFHSLILWSNYYDSTIIMIAP